MKVARPTLTWLVRSMYPLPKEVNPQGEHTTHQGEIRDIHYQPRVAGYRPNADEVDDGASLLADGVARQSGQGDGQAQGDGRPLRA